MNKTVGIDSKNVLANQTVIRREDKELLNKFLFHAVNLVSNETE